MDRKAVQAAFVALALAAAGCGDGGVEPIDGGRLDTGNPQQKCDFQVDGVLLKNCSRKPYLLDDCETDVLSDIDNCGDCYMACPRPPATEDGRGNLIATAWCNQGRCAIACAPDYADCNGLAADGCEVALAADSANCGSCRHQCGAEGAHGKAACVEGVCGLTCDDGFADCDQQAANGCEVSLVSDAANCGSCGYSCSGVGGAASCDFGICAIACVPGRGDCNVDAADGCETDLSTDSLNCGMCGMTCGERACTASVCGS